MQTPENKELERMDLQIRELDREMAEADKRLKRFKQARADVREKNRANLKTMGFSCPEELEKMIKTEGVHPLGMDQFKEVMAEKGQTIPDFLERFAAPKRAGDPDQRLDPGSAPEEPVKKKKRVKIRL